MIFKVLCIFSTAHINKLPTCMLKIQTILTYCLEYLVRLGCFFLWWLISNSESLYSYRLKMQFEVVKAVASLTWFLSSNLISACPKENLWKAALASAVLSEHVPWQTQILFSPCYTNVNTPAIGKEGAFNSHIHHYSSSEVSLHCRTYQWPKYKLFSSSWIIFWQYH